MGDGVHSDVSIEPELHATSDAVLATLDRLRALELEKRDLTSIIMYSVFEEELGHPIKEAKQTIGASLADATSAKLLGVKAGSPLLAIERLTLGTEGRPLELLRSVYLPDYFRLSINLTRQHP